MGVFMESPSFLMNADVGVVAERTIGDLSSEG